MFYVEWEIDSPKPYGQYVGNLWVVNLFYLIQDAEFPATWIWGENYGH